MSNFIDHSNHHFGYKIAISAYREEVWRHLIDVSQWHEWDTELVEAKLDSDFGLNAKGKLVPRKGPKLNFIISEVVPMEYYVFKTKMPVGYLEIKRSLTCRDNTTFFTDDIKFTGLLKNVFGVLLGNGFKSVLPGVMDNFKRIVETKSTKRS